MRYELPVLIDFPQWLAVLVAVVAGYLLGAVPVAYLTSRWRGVDIYSVDSGNPGTANVFLNVGPWWGIWVFSADAAKGIMALVVAGLFGVQGALILLPGAAAVAGQLYPVFQRFQGGGGLATAGGVGMALHPTIGMITLVLTVGLVLPVFRNGGFSAAVGFVIYLIISLAVEAERVVVLASLLLGCLVLLRAMTRPRKAGARLDLGPEGLTTPQEGASALIEPDIDPSGQEKMRPA